jgi:hypothetical protein
MGSTTELAPFARSLRIYRDRATNAWFAYRINGQK